MFEAYQILKLKILHEIYQLYTMIESCNLSHSSFTNSILSFNSSHVSFNLIFNMIIFKYFVDIINTLIIRIVKKE